MRLEFVPLLKVQRRLHEIPRGRERFDAYLAVMCNDDRDDVKFPPLGVVNPMARDHVTALLDDLLALDADAAAARALDAEAGRLATYPGAFRVGLVVADDARGGWTDRHAAEYALAFEGDATRKRGWITAVVWSSEPASAGSAREAVLVAAYREAYIGLHGPARTLGERLSQEGFALAMACAERPTLDPDDLDYTREVLAPLLVAEDKRTCIECLYGDPASIALGLTPRGLSHRAGLALALADAKSISSSSATGRA